MLGLEKKTVLITGAAGGIGRALALRLAQAGAQIALCDRDANALEKLEQEIREQGGVAERYAADIGSQQSCQDLAKSVADRFGAIDSLVHSAGIYPEAKVAEMSTEQWRQLMQINLDGTFYMCQAVMPYLSERSSIVNLSSMAGHRGSYAHAHYSASKGAVTSFSKSLALELAPRTRVNCVAPGIIETPMTRDLLQAKGQSLLASTPLQRFGTAQEVADVILFLCSDLASFVTGETIHVNGGLYMV
ncbi:SDR family NAD(P)-dependent oxidoreductase [Paenalcaligenes suwonensis]|uniref:SDR family NAD(P)-dependent oxidoreductase n=1 Tax=Paenalcaligenes suwonensis TaxID=1202713 RepID=UPI00140C2912|nr:SDR family NAD(P)-dependent oxidoreductase [Paenalcaligenes suwonensis]NHC61456.1 SDR family oxidoreductase [Paenalcaligenes suwonensis]